MGICLSFRPRQWGGWTRNGLTGRMRCILKTLTEYDPFKEFGEASEDVDDNTPWENDNATT
jgi:hypothetical protein